MEKQTEELRRLAEANLLSFPWLRSSYLEWLAACVQYTDAQEESNTEFPSILVSAAHPVRRRICRPMAETSAGSNSVSPGSSGGPVRSRCRHR